MTKSFQLKEKIWRYPGSAGWYFITIPSDITEDIDYFFKEMKKSWGSLPVKVVMPNITWNTSIFPDKKLHSYLLPIKADVRKKEQLKENDIVECTIELTR